MHTNESRHLHTCIGHVVGVTRSWVRVCVCVCVCVCGVCVAVLKGTSSFAW